jgi:hypothetical protein
MREKMSGRVSPDTQRGDISDGGVTTEKKTVTTNPLMTCSIQTDYFPRLGTWLRGRYQYDERIEDEFFALGQRF